MTQSILDAIPAKVAVLDAGGMIVAVSREWRTFCEREGIAGGVGNDYLAACAAFVSGASDLLADARSILHSVLSDGKVDTTFRYPVDDGRLQRWYQVCLAPLDGRDEARGAIAIHLDITESVLAQQSLFELAHYDVLTGLPNRTLFLDRLQQAISGAERHHLKVGVVFIDIDRFKDVNDSFGHAAGDEFLKQFAERLTNCIRKEDTVCRLGGDEFAMILPHLNAAGDAAAFARKLIDTLKTPFQIGTSEIYGSASLGIALFPDDSLDYESLLVHADTAMYRTKQAGHSNFQFYSSAMGENAQARLQLDNDLRQAVEHGEFELYYQPKVSCLSGEIVGMEALMRWHHPQRGVVAPTEFIPELEGLRLINLVGAWAINEVCRQVRQWMDEGLNVPPVAVNLSALQVAGDDLPMTVRDAFQKFRVPSTCLELELTESILMSQVERVIPVLAELKSIGIRLSLDDFGTGYSSLAYLKQFPLDALKVDRSFVHDITVDPNDASITRAIITMAHQLGLKVIAEGVETEGQLAQLIANQCDEIQGYLFSPPVPVQEMGEMLKCGHHLPAELINLDNRQRTILLVDDEASIISALRRTLRSDGYRVLSASSGSEGLEQLAANNVDLIIADQRMPQMSGIEFLRTVKSIYPDTVRIVLSGYTDIQSITDAVNEGAIYRFLMKPWDDELLKKSIENALRHKDLIEENRRLSRNLQIANQELARTNQQLHKVIEVKQREISLDKTILGVAQKLLHRLPIPIVGTDDDGLIVFANEQAAETFGAGKALLGLDVTKTLPGSLAKLLEKSVGDCTNWSNGHRRYVAHCQSLADDDGNEKLLMLVPTVGENYA